MSIPTSGPISQTGSGFGEPPLEEPEDLLKTDHVISENGEPMKKSWSTILRTWILRKVTDPIKAPVKHSYTREETFNRLSHKIGGKNIHWIEHCPVSLGGPLQRPRSNFFDYWEGISDRKPWTYIIYQSPAFYDKLTIDFRRFAFTRSEAPAAWTEHISRMGSNRPIDINQLKFYCEILDLIPWSADFDRALGAWLVKTKTHSIHQSTIMTEEYLPELMLLRNAASSHFTRLRTIANNLSNPFDSEPNQDEKNHNLLRWLQRAYDSEDSEDRSKRL